MRHRRALVPASGFYEWQQTGGKRGQPYWIRPRHGGLVAFAGLIETYAEPGGSEMDTGAILTINANADIAHIHDRMPVVIDREDFARWLDCRTLEPRDVADLLEPAQPDFFEAVPVSDLVNKVANTGPEIQDKGRRRAGAREGQAPEARRGRQSDDLVLAGKVLPLGASRLRCRRLAPAARHLRQRAAIRSSAPAFSSSRCEEGRRRSRPGRSPGSGWQAPVAWRGWILCLVRSIVLFPW